MCGARCTDDAFTCAPSCTFDSRGPPFGGENFGDDGGGALCTSGSGGGQALTAMRQLHSEGAVLRELIDQFEAAEAWLAPMRP